MARYYYPGGEIIAAAGAGSPAVLTLSPAQEFTVWSAEEGGSQYTDLLQADGATPLPVAGSGKPFCDSNGKPPGLYGPDGVKTVLWRDTGSGSGPRYPMYPSTEITAVLTNGVRTNVANTFTAAQAFTAAVTMSQTPTVSGSDLVTEAEFPSHFSTQQLAYGAPLTLYYDGTNWPSLSVVPADYIASGRFIVWDSQTYLGAPEPPITAREDDFWDKQVT